VADDHIGGFIIFEGTRETVTATTRELQSLSETPLFFSCDIEPGLTPRIADMTFFPHAMAIGRTTPELCERAAECIADEALATGIKINFAPVCDVNSNPKNPIINTRSFGETAEHVARFSNAFIKGTQRRGVISVAKHFPGHGDTEKDSHLELPLLSIPRKRFDELELIPFIEAIKNNVGSVMAAHIIAPAFDEKYPATLSPRVITALLRNELGFNGLVFTDALMMRAITKNYSAGEAAKLAALAGCDILLMPEEVNTAINALFEEAKANTELNRCIENANERITKAKKSIHAQKMPSPINLSGNLSGHAKIAEQIASRSTQIEGNKNIINKIGKKHETTAFVLAGADKEAENIEYAKGIISTIKEKSNLKVKLYINPEILIEKNIDYLILMIFNGVYSFQGNLGDKNSFLQQAERCLHAGAANVIGVSLGSPYIWNELPRFPVTMNCFSNSRVSIRTAIEQLLANNH
jgi:beta-glucosidase-like glycosyl hydrolase